MFDRSENVDKSDSVGDNLFDAARLNYTLCGARAIFRRLKVLAEITEKKKSFLNAGLLWGHLKILIDSDQRKRRR